MKLCSRTLAIASVVVALAGSTLATPGNGNGPGNNNGQGQGQGNGSGNANRGRGRHSGGSTSSSAYLVGDVVCSDTRVLDLTGEYTLGTSVSVALSVTQDDRGRLVSTGTLSGDDGASQAIRLRGHLQLTGQDTLRVQLAGGPAGLFIDDDDDDDDDDNNELSNRVTKSGKHKKKNGNGDRGRGRGRNRPDRDSDDDNTSDTDDDDDDGDDDDDADDGDDSSTSGPSVRIRGEWDGEAFQVQVTVSTTSGTTESFAAELVPVNPERGFTVADAEVRPQGRGGNVRSTREVILPWGTETASAQQKGKRSRLMFQAHGSNFHLDLRGSVAGTSVTVTSTHVVLGYGSLFVPNEDVTVSPSAFSAP